jgi:putative transposase
MINGFKTTAYPTSFQKKNLSLWAYGANFIWNAKCQEDKYLRTFAQKYLPIGTYPKIDQTYCQYKNNEYSPWLKKCPSQILRNSASNWYDTYKNFLKGLCNRPKIKNKDKYSILLTRELFRIDIDEKTKKIKLFIGTKTNNIGYLEVKWHNKKFLKCHVNSIRIKKTPYGKYTISFCYGEKTPALNTKWLDYLKTLEEEKLNKMVLGVDRGIKVICATDDDRRFYARKEETKSLIKSEIKKKRYQKRLARQQKESKRRENTKKKLAKVHEKKKNIRNNICHNISKKLVETQDIKVIVFENLNTKNMTKTAKGDKKNPGRNVKQKSGLNREILNKAWHKLEEFTIYKASRLDKVVFKVDPKYSSQECACCGHIQPQNRKGDKFKCLNTSCNNEDHADNNAGKTLKKRAIKLLLYSGTELSDVNVLKDTSDAVRGAKVRPVLPQGKQAVAERRKKRRIA